jgi:phenylacetate-CoA ligase
MLQNKKLHALAVHCWENVPYYRRIFHEAGITPDDIRTVGDLEKLPVLTKSDIREHATDLRAVNVPLSTQMKSQSSGSTGEPIQYYIDKASYSAGWAQTFRCWGWAGYRLGDPYIKISLNPRDSIKKQLQDRIFNTKYIYGAGISESNISDLVDVFRTVRPRIIRNYASHMFAIAKLMEKAGLSYTGATVATTGSTLFPPYRKTIEAIFHGKVFDAYGGESTPVAFECPAHEGYHLCDEDVIVEFLKDGDAVGPGETGRIVLTNLNNFGMPLLRYDLQDAGIYAEEACTCGRSLSRLAAIHGRDSDIIQTPSGDLVVVEFFVILFEYLPGVVQFQVIQESLERVVVSLVTNEKFSDEQYAYIQSRMKERLGPEVSVEFKFVDAISTAGRSGKRRFVISRVPFR